jgi:uncharacterized membrane protein YphA (DoxX/SURF4 family)
VVGLVLAYASYEKILDPQGFARVVYRYRLAGPTATTGFVPPNVLAAVLPWLELIVGLLLVANVWRREAAAVAASLMAVFIGAVGYTLAAGIDVGGCGCFTLDAGGRAAGWGLIAADAGLLVLALWAATGPPPHAAPRPAAAGEPAHPVTASVPAP